MKCKYGIDLSICKAGSGSDSEKCPMEENCPHNKAELKKELLRCVCEKAPINPLISSFNAYRVCHPDYGIVGSSNKIWGAWTEAARTFRTIERLTK